MSESSETDKPKAVKAPRKATPKRTTRKPVKPIASAAGLREAAKLETLLNEVKGKVAIFTHVGPDSDALCAMESVKWLLMKGHDLESVCFCDGQISHPQNRATIENLDISYQKISEYDPKEFVFHVIVDASPGDYAGVGSNDIKFDVVIDHHKKLPNADFKGLYINLHAGSACATVYELMKQYKLEFKPEEEEDSKIATAIMIGVMTDTDHLCSEDTSGYDFKANLELFHLRDKDAFKRITRWRLPQSWITIEASATLNALRSVEDGVAITGLGIIQENQRDVIAHFADLVVNWAGVDSAVIFAIIECEDGVGDRVEGCVRSTDTTVSVAELCAELGGSFGGGGGKAGKGRYYIPLNEFSIGSQVNGEIKQKTWELVSLTQIERIRKIVKK